MNTTRIICRTQLPILALAASLFLAACGGSSNSEPPVAVPPAQSTGIVGLLFTDKPTDDYSAIKLNVVEAILIGGDDGQQMLFKGSEPIDLLDLTNFNEPIVFGEVAVGTYTKLRLVIDDLELVRKDDGASIFPKLPANGKIDLLDSNGFEVLPGRTLLVAIDMDANKSIKITGAGNSDKVNFRPVVRVNFMDGGMQDKLARVEGVVSEKFTNPANSFELCDIDTPVNCINVATGADTSIFDDEGLPTNFDTLMVNDMVVVIGRYDVEGDPILDAVVLEIGGNAEQLKGNVVSAPMNDEFLLRVDGNGDVVVALQPGSTKYFDAEGPIGPDAIVVGADIEVEGVLPAKALDTDPDVIRAALVFVEAEEADQLSGTITGTPDSAMRTFVLAPDDVSVDACTVVHVADGAEILLVDAVASEVSDGKFSDLAVDQHVDLFGAIVTDDASDTCFEASEVIVDADTEGT